MGGLDVGGHAEGCRGYYASMVLACWPELQRTCPILAGLSIDTCNLPMFTECCHHYQALCGERDRIDTIRGVETEVADAMVTASVAPPAP